MYLESVEKWKKATANSNCIVEYEEHWEKGDTIFQVMEFTSCKTVADEISYRKKTGRNFSNLVIYLLFVYVCIYRKYRNV
jgi:hypothetical protein